MRALAFVVAVAGLATAHAEDMQASTVGDKGLGALKVACLDTAGDFARIDAAASALSWRKLTAAEVEQIDATQLQTRMPVLAASAWAGEFEGVPVWVYATERDRSADGSATDRARHCDILAPPGDHQSIRDKLKTVCPGKVAWDQDFGGTHLISMERVENGVKYSCGYIGGRALRIPSFNGGKPYDVFQYSAFQESKRQ